MGKNELAVIAAWVEKFGKEREARVEEIDVVFEERLKTRRLLLYFVKEGFKRGKLTPQEYQEWDRASAAFDRLTKELDRLSEQRRAGEKRPSWQVL